MGRARMSWAAGPRSQQPQRRVRKPPPLSLPTGSPRAYRTPRPHWTARPLREYPRLTALGDADPSSCRGPVLVLSMPICLPAGSRRRAGTSGPAGPLWAERRRRSERFPWASGPRGAAGKSGVGTVIGLISPHVCCAPPRPHTSSPALPSCSLPS